MRFIQSSDFHLRPDAPQRLEALREVVGHATEQSADALLIPGDLFDTPEAAGPLRPQVRSILESFSGTTVITPGNHDATAFPPQADWGRRTVVLAATPFQEHVLRTPGGEEARIFGAPYQERTTLGQVLAGLEIKDPLRTVGLAHGTFEGSWHTSIADEGDEAAYLPIRDEDLRGRFAYAALGHLHSRVTFDDWQPGEAWGYAGSPVSVTRGELGPRHAVLVEFEPGTGVRSIERLRLRTSYWESVAVNAAPWETAGDAIDRLRRTLAEASAPEDPHRGLRVTVQGWIEGDETEFRDGVQQEVDRLAAAHREIDLEVTVRTISSVLTQRPEIEDLLERLRRLGRERGADEATVQMAAGMVVGAAAGAAR